MHSKFLFIILSILSFSVLGQKFATSPFSSYGLGEFGTYDNATFVGYGNAQVGVVDSLNLNYYNPSSYAFLGHGQPLFSTGISFKNSLYTENSESFSTNLVGINHFVFAVPFAKVCGLAFGLKPFSRVGYNLYDLQSFGTDTLKYTYTGNGSINDAFVGFSLKVLNAKKHQIGIGSNVSFLFGNTQNQRFSNLNSQIIGGLETTKYQTRSLYYNLGFNYQYMITKNQTFSLGMTYNSKQDISTIKNLDLFVLNDVNDVTSIIDTISTFSEKNTITMPSMFDLGFMHSFRPKVDSSYNKVKIFQLNVYGSYQVENWSEYQANFSNDSSIALLNTNRISFGLEFTPHYNYLDRTKAIGYFQRVRYRAGFQYATLPIERNNIQLTSTAFTFGFSLPIISQRSVSSLNFGFSYGNRGNGETANLNERFMGINFGITLAPGAYDRWFRKYKID